jgi:2-dehydro-3-deoxygalactonokinase
MAALQNGKFAEIKLVELINTKQMFLSCDWGTSSFRLRLASIPALEILAEVSSDQGIASTYELWKKENKDQGQRLTYYQNIIKQNIEKLEHKLKVSLANVPLILSGMASSSIGMKELPYKELPLSMDGSDLFIDTLQATQDFQHYTIIVSGARSADDVMRGEEIQLVGGIDGDIISEPVFILPGTHSKHVHTKDGKAIEVKTYMTGELFDLLSTKSILATSVEKNDSFDEKNNQQAFKSGLEDSFANNPLHAFFLVRTNQLFQRFCKSENYYYLSGLLIGLELNGLAKENNPAITLICNNTLKALYQNALEHLGFTHNLTIVDIDEAILKGHYQIFRRYLPGVSNDI